MLLWIIVSTYLAGFCLIFHLIWWRFDKDISVAFMLSAFWPVVVFVLGVGSLYESLESIERRLKHKRHKP